MSQCNVLSQALRSLSSAEFVTSTVQFHVVFSWGYRFETIGLGLILSWLLGHLSLHYVSTNHFEGISAEGYPSKH